MKIEKRTELILNIVQADYYWKNGAVLVNFGLVYSERHKKPKVGFTFKIDEKYLELKDNWMSRKR